VIVFVDTSALYALLDADDENHPTASRRWRALLEREATLVTSNYVVVETCALVQHRLGLPALRALRDDLLPVVRVEWIEREEHDAALSAVLAAMRRDLSFVDCSSFEMARRLGIKSGFAFDRHFREQGLRQPT